MDIEEIERGLKELDQIEMMVKHQRKILNDMLGIEPEVISLTKTIVKAIDEYIADKPIASRKDEKSNDTQTILKIINSETTDSVIVKITNFDWV